jgi:hypothetical protein
MKLKIKKGDKYIIGKNIFYTWTKYRDEEDTIPELHPIDTVHKNHAIYVEVVKINKISPQFIYVEFEPVSKDINGNANKCGFVVYNDAIVQLPDQHMNYIGESKLLKEMVPATPEIEEYVKRINALYGEERIKQKEFSKELDSLKIRIEEYATTQAAKRDIVKEEFSELLDGLIFAKAEEDAYNKEMLKFIKD